MLQLNDYRELCAELYQVLGALDAPARVLDKVLAAASGEPFPDIELLPFVPDAGGSIAVAEQPSSAVPEAVRALLERSAGILGSQGFAAWDELAAEIHTTLAEAIQPPTRVEPAGEVVVTRNNAGQILAVTRQDEEGRILSIAEADHLPPAQPDGLGRVYDLIGLHRSQPMDVLLVNIGNMKRFTELLWAVEREFFMVPGEPSGEHEDEGFEPDDECLVNSWGSKQADYIEQFRVALKVIAPLSSVQVRPEVLVTGHLDEIDAPAWEFINAEAAKVGPATGHIDAYRYDQANGGVVVLWDAQRLHAIAATIRDDMNRTRCIRILTAPQAAASQADGGQPSSASEQNAKSFSTSTGSERNEQ